MHNSSDEWVWTRLDGEREDGTLLRPDQAARIEAEQRLERELANRLAEGGDCPDQLWEGLRAKLDAPRQRLPIAFRFRTARRLAVAALAASLLVVTSSGVTVHLLRRPVAPVVEPVVAVQPVHPVSKPGRQLLLKREQAAVAEEKAALEQQLAEAQSHVEQAQDERKRAISERDTATGRVQELTKELELARSEMDLLRTTLASASAEGDALRAELQGLKEAANRLGVDLATWIPGLTNPAPAEESMLSMAPPDAAKPEQSVPEAAAP